MDKKKTGGRPHKEMNDAFSVKISFRLTPQELVEFERLMGDLEIKSKTDFIKACIFNKNIHVVKEDKNIFEYWKILNNLQAQYKAVGNNYNQATKAIKTAFSEKKALSFLYSLVQETRELIAVNNRIIELTEKLNGKWLQK